MLIGCPAQTACSFSAALKRSSTAHFANCSCVVPNSNMWRCLISP